MIIETKGLNKSFIQDKEEITVLKDVNVKFETGKIYALIGTNGSGKSVFLKILCGLYKPTNGEILFDNENYIEKNEIPKDTRALIEKPGFIPEITGLENLMLLASISSNISREKIIEVLEKVDLKENMNKKYSKYSLGMKQKLGIAQVLMENPKVMIFDEPFNGIAVDTANKIRKILKDLKKEKIIIIATHIKEDIESLADVVYKFELGNVKYEKN